MQLAVIIASTRPGRAGLPIGRWFHELASGHGKFAATKLLDLAEVNLPLFDEPEHPRLRKYQQQHTKDWSAAVAAADAFAIVTAEYNYTPPPSLINALDFVYHEWNYKPVGFVSYGGVSGGTRAVQVLRQMAVGMRMMPIVESVHLPFYAQHMTPEGFKPPPPSAKAAADMLDELWKCAGALAPLRGR
jgi:NAD(P)H-dependent FMN reductase